MSNALLIIGLVVVGLVAVVLIMAAMKPDTFTLARSTTINAPPAKVFPLINDFQQWRGWSPWEKLDPDLKRTYGATTSGQGATYSWVGNKNVGQGSMEITESTPSSRVGLKLDFIKPFEAHNTVMFTLEPRGAQTHVNWAMTGPNLFMGKLISVFMSMDKMVGKSFEEGLANLKALAER